VHVCACMYARVCACMCMPLLLTLLTLLLSLSVSLLLPLFLSLPSHTRRSHLLHYVVIVAAEDIPKYTELSYDYGNLYIIQGDVSGAAGGFTLSGLAGGFSMCRSAGGFTSSVSALCHNKRLVSLVWGAPLSGESIHL
jgi:hypothetical protein